MLYSEASETAVQRDFLVGVRDRQVYREKAKEE